MTGKMNEGILPAKAFGDVDGLRIVLAVLREIFSTIMGFFGVLDIFGLSGGDGGA